MKTETIDIVSKGKVLGQAEYKYPETFEETCECDGEAIVFEAYSKARRAQFIAARRNMLNGSGIQTKIAKVVMEMLKDSSKIGDVGRFVAGSGVELSDEVQAMIAAQDIVGG